MVDTDTRAELRLLVHRFRQQTRRRVFAPVLHVGGFDGASLEWSLDERPAPDVGLRAEILAALVSRARLEHEQPVVWLSRMGVPAPHDLDLAWAPVAARAMSEARLAPRCIVVVTKTGWYEPLGDDRATWTRLRVRSG
ncbi:hypothetical protein [Nocardioides jensenii]|uniref:hypothetical protein n=1 Tax=Nocardioides jensenii TaxID=1843 RepID=UPI00082B174D|nr:hypothetical protein [Nocardioides jensenii]